MISGCSNIDFLYVTENEGIETVGKGGGIDARNVIKTNYNTLLPVPRDRVKINNRHNGC